MRSFLNGVARWIAIVCAFALLGVVQMPVESPVQSTAQIYAFIFFIVIFFGCAIVMARTEE